MSYLNHVSFIKIDIDGADVDIVRSFAPMIKEINTAHSSSSSTKFFRPVFLIEWFQKYRQNSPENGECSAEAAAAWTVAHDMNYKVYDWRFQNEFETCEVALRFYHGYMGPKSRKIDLCGNGRDELDLCDLLLVHADSISQEGSKLKTVCPPALEISIVGDLKRKWSHFSDNTAAVAVDER